MNQAQRFASPFTSLASSYRLLRMTFHDGTARVRPMRSSKVSLQSTNAVAMHATARALGASRYLRWNVSWPIAAAILAVLCANAAIAASPQESLHQGVEFVRQGQFDQAEAVLSRLAGTADGGILVAANVYLGIARQGQGEHASALSALFVAQHAVDQAGAEDLNLRKQLRCLYARSWVAIAGSRETRRILSEMGRETFGDRWWRQESPLYELGRQWRVSGILEDTVSLFSEVISQLESALGTDSLALLPPLHERSLSYFEQGEYGPAVSDLERSLELATASGEIEQQIDAHVRLADMLMATGRTSTAWPYYKTAFELAHAHRHDAWISRLSTPGMIDPGPWLFERRGHDDEIPYLEFHLKVSDNGQPLEVKVVDSNLSKRVLRKSQVAFRESVIRPAMTDSGPVVTDSWSYHYEHPVQGKDPCRQGGHQRPR